MHNVIRNNNPKHRKSKKGIAWKVHRPPDLIERKLCRTSGTVLTDISGKWAKIRGEMSRRIQSECYNREDPGTARSWR